MKPQLTLNALLVALALASPVTLVAATTFDAPAIEQAVLAANAEMLAAANRMDMDGFFGCIIDTERGVIVQNGTVFATRAEARTAVEAGLRGVARVDRRFDNPKVTVISSETALLVSEGSVTATLDDGRVVNGRFAVSLVFVWRDGRWLVLHGHYSVPPAAR